MKKYVLPLIVLFISACSNSENGETRQETSQENNFSEKLEKNDTIDKELRFNELNAQAVLIGEKIELLNEDLRKIKDITGLNGTIVDVVGVSDSLFIHSEDFCDSYWYVQIESPKINGIVNGRKVFKIQDSRKDTSFIVNDNHIEILTTEFFGMGVTFEGDLMGCPVDQPILLRDSENNYFGLVNLIINEYSKKARWGKEYPYLEIRNDHGSSDKIVSISSEESEIRLEFKRGFQEGQNTYDVILEYSNGEYWAKFLNYGEIKYR